MKDIAITAFYDEMLRQLPNGALLAVAENGRTNLMTIGWGSLGVIWRKPIFTVMVRCSRYTYELLEKSREFTVNVPLAADLKKELALCGTKSGRNMDKFQESGLTPATAKIVTAPIVKECELHYECRVVYQQAMEPALLNGEIKSAFYPQGNYHVIYYGEVLAAYLNE